MTKPKNYIAYEGSKFIIEWYYTKEGKIPALDYFNALNEDDKIKAINLFKLMATEGKIFNKQKFRNEHDQIYAFKPQPHRFMCFFFVGKRIIITNGFMKKKDELPPEEKKRALKHKVDYEERFNAGEYYNETK